MYEKQMLSSFVAIVPIMVSQPYLHACAQDCVVSAGLLKCSACTVNVITLFTPCAIYYTQFSNFTVLADMR